MEFRRVSEAVIRRMPKYYRQLTVLRDQGMERISSGRLAQMMRLNASQVRQDFNCFGGFGQQGYGYNVKEELLGTEIDGKPVYHIDEMERYVQENNITIGVIAARRSVAQEIADRMVASGIKGIWNFAPMDVTATVPVENIHMTDSLICLMYKMHHNVISEN